MENTEILVEAVQLIEDTSRETAMELFFHLNDYLDVLIPRGGKNLIETVIKESTVPVLETGAGNCHIFIDQTADITMVEKIVLNGKTQRPSVCNAIEGLLIHEKWFLKKMECVFWNSWTKRVLNYMEMKRFCSSFPRAKTATEEDWSTGVPGFKTQRVKTVKGVSDAIDHINRYGFQAF